MRVVFKLTLAVCALRRVPKEITPRKARLRHLRTNYTITSSELKAKIKHGFTVKTFHRLIHGTDMSGVQQTIHTTSRDIKIPVPFTTASCCASELPSLPDPLPTMEVAQRLKQ